MDVNKRMLELATKWKEENPNATEDEQKTAFDKIVGQIVHELMQKGKS